MYTIFTGISELLRKKSRTFYCVGVSWDAANGSLSLYLYNNLTYKKKCFIPFFFYLVVVLERTYEEWFIIKQFLLFWWAQVYVGAHRRIKKIREGIKEMQKKRSPHFYIDESAFRHFYNKNACTFYYTFYEQNYFFFVRFLDFCLAEKHLAWHGQQYLKKNKSLLFILKYLRVCLLKVGKIFFSQFLGNNYGRFFIFIF